MKGYAKDKSEIEEIRCKLFYRESDMALKTLLKVVTPLILMGVEKDLAWFEHISKNSRNIIGRIHGNYGYASRKQLGDLAWNIMEAHLQRKNQDVLNMFTKKIGSHLGISGIQEVWQAACEGRAQKLLVEKDYRCPGFVDNNESHLFLRPPSHKHKVLADAVDDLIEIILSKNGEIHFMENGSLESYKRIALITRY